MGAKKPWVLLVLVEKGLFRGLGIRVIIHDMLPDDVYVQQHALVFTSNAIPSQQSEWRAPSSVQAQPQEAIESEDWSGVGLTASNPAAGVDQTAADEAQSITASISPTYETTELDEELINLILQRDSYDMDPLLGNADEWTEPHRPPDAAQVSLWHGWPMDGLKFASQKRGQVKVLCFVFFGNPITMFFWCPNESKFTEKSYN